MKKSTLLLALFTLSLGLRAQITDPKQTAQKRQGIIGQLVIGAFVRVQHGSHGINKKIR